MEGTISALAAPILPKVGMATATLRAVLTLAFVHVARQDGRAAAADGGCCAPRGGGHGDKVLMVATPRPCGAALGG